jgi:hypothetical protein
MKSSWRKSEVIAYLESKIVDNQENEDEINLYQDWKWDGVFPSNVRTYWSLVKEMDKEWK